MAQTAFGVGRSAIAAHSETGPGTSDVVRVDEVGVLKADYFPGAVAEHLRHSRIHLCCESARVGDPDSFCTRLRDGVKGRFAAGQATGRVVLLVFIGTCFCEFRLEDGYPREEGFD